MMDQGLLAGYCGPSIPDAEEHQLGGNLSCPASNFSGQLDGNRILDMVLRHMVEVEAQALSPCQSDQ